MDRMTEIEALVERHRATCLWFMDASFRADTPARARRALDAIARYGDREAFVRATDLKEWLSRKYSETSSA